MFSKSPSSAKIARLFVLFIGFSLYQLVLLGQSTELLPVDTTQYQLQEVIYKTTPQADLKLHFYKPKDNKGESLPAILFFFGGGWVGGSHGHFAPHSKYLASRGMIAITADYRVKNQHGTTPVEAIQDARDALHYLVENGNSLGIDTARLAVGGGSAGGHLALCTALIEGFDTQPFWYSPKVLVLFNPVVNTTSEGFGAKALGKDSLRASPVHHLKKGLPPTIIFHGEDDTTVPLTNIVEMKKKMDSLLIEGEYYFYSDQTHGFFNIGRQPQHRYFLETLYRTDRFLEKQGFLVGNPTFHKID